MCDEHDMRYFSSDGCYICVKCGEASNEAVLEDTEYLPYVPGIDSQDIAARQLAVHYGYTPKDDAKREFLTEDETKVNDRLTSGFKEFKDHVQEKLSININDYNSSSLDFAYTVWKLFYRNQETFLKYKKRSLYLQALGYVMAVHAKDVTLMSKYLTKAFKTQIRLITRDTDVMKLFTFPSNQDILQMYADAWIPRITPNPAMQNHVKTLFERYMDMYSDVAEPRDFTAALIWKLVSPLSMMKGGFRITQQQLHKITNSKSPTFTKISAGIRLDANTL